MGILVILHILTDHYGVSVIFCIAFIFRYVNLQIFTLRLMQIFAR